MDEDFGRRFFVHHTASGHQFRLWLSSAMEWAGLRCNRDVEIGSALDYEFMGRVGKTLNRGLLPDRQ